MKEEKKVTFYLFKKQKIYRTHTWISFYFRSNKQIKKEYQPITINNERFKLDLETGEYRNYLKNEILLNDHNSVARTKRLLDMLLLMNDFDWFATLTFDKSKVDRTSAEVVYRSYKKFIDNLKQQYPTFRYVTVPEKHEDGCFHFHLLIGGLTPKQLGLVYSCKVCCHWATHKNKICSLEYFEKTKSNYELIETDGLKIYNVTNFIFGYTTVTRIANREKCNSYVKKYLEKAFGCTGVFKKRFFYSSNLKTPRILTEEIGSDFEVPKRLNSFNFKDNKFLVENSDSSYYSDNYNVLQIKVNNEKLEYLKRNLCPIENSEVVF